MATMFGLQDKEQQTERLEGFPKKKKKKKTRTKTFKIRKGAHSLIIRDTGCKWHANIIYIIFIVQELYESRGGRPGLSVLTSLLVSVDVKIY